MDSIRQADRGRIRPEQTEALESESISIEFNDGEFNENDPIHDEEGRINSLLEVEYPFEGQREFTGTITYQKQTSSTLLQPDPEEYNFRFRTNSGLFILEGEMPDSKSRSIFKQLGDRLESSFDDKLHFVHKSKKGLWSFILKASDRTQLIARDGFEKLDLEEFEGDLFFDGDISSEADLSLEKLTKRYLVDRARLVFYYDTERINVSIEDGVLNFVDSVSPEGKEYVIQLYEKYAVNGDTVEEMDE